MPRKTEPARAPAASKAARKTQRAAKRSAATDLEQQAPAQQLIDAGIKTLGTVRDQMVSQQGRVFEAMLGVNPAQVLADATKRQTEGAEPAALDPFGFRKFEDIFDQRVARALQRLGMPSPDEVCALRDEVQALRKALQDLKATTPKTPRGG